jgi:mannose/fructose/N-acetylgalactosamine-specific phosphotransferase system component IIB
MPVVLARIDDRLVHGQVVGSWIRSYKINVIIIIDDDMAKDKVQLDVFAMTTPPGVQLFAQSVLGFIDKYNKGILDKYTVMVVFKDTVALTQIAKAGVKFPIGFINVGGMRFKTGRVQITNSVSVAPFEIDNLLYLNEFGYKLEYRQVLEHEPVDLVPLIKSQIKKGV